MKWVWTWGGTSFGFVEGNCLWTQDGRHVGIVYENNDVQEIYNSSGYYLGEIKNENRLITNLSKKGRRNSSFAPFANRVGYVPYVNYVGYVMYVGYEDFPEPDNL